MARFVVIDHSVTSPGGHNFEHANDVLHAAEELGYEPVLAANQAIAGRRDLPQNWNILPVFPDGWDPLHWLGPDGRSFVPTDIDGELLPLDDDAYRPRSVLDQLGLAYRQWRDQRRTKDRRFRIQRFAQGCREFWDAIRPGTEDRILLPSVTEFDLLGLISFFRDEPESAAVDWHMLFHFNLFTGRTPSYQRQSQTQRRFQQLFDSALAEVPDHRLHFYGVTNLIAEQYNHLQSVTFSEMPYTINGSIDVNRESQPQSPLRLTCPGVIRREKGKRRIRDLVRNVWADHLDPGKLQLFFQGQPKDLRRFFPRETFHRSAFSEAPDTSSEAPIVIVRHPLSADHYAKLIRESHIGLFLHDSQRYFGRCSGTLVELLGAGVPVVVPAGCWLAEQVAEPNFQHLERLAQSPVAIGHLEADAVTWDSVPRRRVELTCGVRKNALRGRTPVPSDAANVMVSWLLDSDTAPGHYLRVVADVLDAGGKPLMDPQQSIVGRRESGQAAATLFHLAPGANSVRLTFSNAFEQMPLTVNQLSLTFLGTTGSGRRGSPAGAVGLVAAGLDQYSRLLSDLTEHYDHYRRSATDFAAAWAQSHSAEAVIRQIDDASCQAQRRAAA